MALTAVLDDVDSINEELDLLDLTTTMDDTHRFVNFSRKVTEASSMKKPVDIQLGIASGKGFFSQQGSPSMWVAAKHHQPQRKLDQTTNNIPAPSFTSAKDENPKAETHPPTILILDEDDSSSSTTSTSTASNYTYDTNDKIISDNSGTTTDPYYSSLLEQLVNDVLNHIESCPHKTAYSMDLDRLTPRLKAYNSNKEFSK